MTQVFRFLFSHYSTPITNLIKGKFWLTLVILLNLSSSIKLMLLVNITSLTIYILGSNGPTFRFVWLPGGLENIPYKELVGF